MTYTTLPSLPDSVAAGLKAGSLAPYLGAGMLALCPGATPPAQAPDLAMFLSGRASVPGKIRNRLTATAQFIENFKHRKTLVKLMDEAFATTAVPSPLHHWLAALAGPLIVDTWYDDTTGAALAAAGRSFMQVQGLSQSEHFGTWFGWYDATGALRPDPAPGATVFYKPWGGHSPAANYLISDSDFVEVLTEIDIQTPIPPVVQTMRADLGFVFLGCRFNDQLPRAFARQIMKRSKGPHFAVLADEPTRMEARFLAEQGITRIAMTLAQVAAALTGQTMPA